MKKFVSIPALIIAVVLFAGCTTLETQENPSPTLPTEISTQTPVPTIENTPSELPTPEEEKSDSPKDYVGLTLSGAQILAKENNVPFRLVQEDGEFLPATMDYVIGRINASMQDGIVVSYSVEGSNEFTEEEKSSTMTYDEDSWRDTISPSCNAFFDGCNNCRRVEGSEGEAACTRKFCQEFQEPQCLDDNN